MLFVGYSLQLSRLILLVGGAGLKCLWTRRRCPSFVKEKEGTAVLRLTDLGVWSWAKVGCLA